MKEKKNYRLINQFFDSRGLLAIIILFHLFNNIVWWQKSGLVSEGAHSVWLEERALEYVSVLRNGDYSPARKIFKTFEIFTLAHSDYVFKPVNFNLSTFFIAFPLAANLQTTQKLFWVNMIMFSQWVLVLLAIYCLGKIVFHRSAGAWSAVIFSFYPGVCGISRMINSELIITLFIVLSVIIFIRWKTLRQSIRIPGLLIIGVLGTLSGGLFLVFFIPLILFHFFSILTFRKNGKKLTGLFETGSFLLLFFLFFHFYCSGEYLRVFTSLTESFNEAWQKLTLQSTDFIGSADNAVIESFLMAKQDSFCPCTQTTNVGFNVKTFMFYFFEIIYFTSPLFFLLAVVSCVSLFKKSRLINTGIKPFMAVWGVGGYILLTLYHIKWGKFIIPLLPVLSLCSGFFVGADSRKKDFTKIIVFILGILTVIYYSYFSAPGKKHFLEKLHSGGIISHQPIPSKRVEIAEQIAEKINNSYIPGEDMVSIAFLDKDSARFQAFWVTDKTVKMEHLIKISLKGDSQTRRFWNLSDTYYATLSESDFMILITSEKIENPEAYLFPQGKDASLKIKFQNLYENQLQEEVFIYLMKIINGNDLAGS